MSLQTWKEEFYPVPAETVQQDDALAHSLKKWQGLTPESVAKHGVSFDGWGDLTDGKAYFKANAETCALCEHFQNYNSDESLCLHCPLAIARGGVPCDSEMDDEEYSPWHTFLYEGDPTPMIYWLEKAIESN